MMTALRIPALIGSRACVARQLVELEQRQHSTAALADREAVRLEDDWPAKTLVEVAFPGNPALPK
jgi:hypothetical protein